MTVTGTYEANDLISAAWVHLRPRPSLRWVGIVLVVLAVVAMFVNFRVAPEDARWVAWFLPLTFLYIVLAYGFGIPYKARRAYKQRKDLQRPISFTATESGLSFATEGSSGVKPWADFHKWKEGKSTLLLYLSDNLYQAVPKRFFASERELDAFREVVSQRIARRVA
jgi:hypothetical protein